MAIRCLIVDDRPVFGRLAVDLLEGEEIDVVRLATSSGEAVRLAAELRPDLALVDINLGEESGFELASLLSGELVRAVILISSRGGEEVAEVIAASPAGGYIG